MRVDIFGYLGKTYMARQTCARQAEYDCCIAHLELQFTHEAKWDVASMVLECVRIYAWRDWTPMVAAVDNFEPMVDSGDIWTFIVGCVAKKEVPSDNSWYARDQADARSVTSTSNTKSCLAKWCRQRIGSLFITTRQ
jgi:hypothetical protein